MSLRPFHSQLNHYGVIPGTLRDGVKTYHNGHNDTISGSELSIWCTTIIFSVHVDSVYDIMSSNMWCVEIEQRFVELITVCNVIDRQKCDKTEVSNYRSAF